MSEPARVPGLSPRTIHHSGYTGQSICVDPETGFAGVVLTVRSAGEGTFTGRLRILSLLNGDLAARVLHRRIRLLSVIPRRIRF